MGKYRVTWIDGAGIDVDAPNGTEAKAEARKRRGVKKSDCKIASVEPIEASTPASTVDARASA